MLKVRYTYQGQSGELELSSIVDYESVEEIERKLNSCPFLPISVIETVLSKIDPQKLFQEPELPAQQRGGERNMYNPQEFATLNGFTSLEYSINNKYDLIL